MPPFIVCELRRGGKGGPGVKVFGGKDGGTSRTRSGVRGTGVEESLIRGGNGGGLSWLSSPSMAGVGGTPETDTKLLM